jgi:hypothetical protein
MTAPHWVEEYFAPPGPALLNESTGTIHNVVTTDGPARRRNHRFTGVAPTITGFASGATSRAITLFAVGGPIVLKHENAGSLAANRISTPGGTDFTVPENGAIELVYDGDSTRWRVASPGGSLGGGAGEANTSSNTGAGAQLAKAKVGVDLPFRTVSAPRTLAAFFGANHAHLWASYDGTTGVLTDSVGGKDAAPITSTPTAATISGVGNVAVAQGTNEILVSRAPGPITTYPTFSEDTVNAGLVTDEDVDTLNGSTSWTVYALFRATGENQGAIIDKELQLYVELDSTGVLAVSNYSGGIDGARIVNDGEWHRVIYTQNGATVSLYVDGVADGTQGGQGALSTASNPMLFGQQPAENMMNGGTVIVGIATRGVSADEVAELDSIIAAYAGGGASASGGGNPLTDEEYTWDRGASKKFSTLLTYDDTGTPDEEAYSVALTDEATTRFVVNAQARGPSAEFYQAELSATFDRTDGTSDTLVAPAAQNEESNAGGADYTAEIDLDGDDVKVLVNGDAGVRWTLLVTRLVTSLGADIVLDPPSILSVTPDTGVEAGGDPITIAGTGFQSGATVTIGGVACTSVVVVDPTEITCDTPAGSAGAEDVVVTNPDMQFDTLAGGFTYEVDAFSPADDTSLRAWYDMGLGATVVSGNVTALADQSGTGDANKHLTAAGDLIARTATDAAYNNQATATFGGLQRMDPAGAWAVSLPQPFTIYAVGQASNDGGRLVDAAAGGRAIVMRNGTLWSLYAGGANNLDATGSAPGSPTKICGVFNGASSQIYIGSDFSTGTGTGTNPGVDTPLRFALGALVGGGGELIGKIAAVIICAGAHDATKRAQYATYFATRFGL